jgi:hypothetical protein
MGWARGRKGDGLQVVKEKINWAKKEGGLLGEDGKERGQRERPGLEGVLLK